MRYLFLQLAQTIPPQIQERADEIVEQVKANPVLMWTLVGVGAFTALVFVIGIMKSAFKAAFLGAVLSVAAWVWYFNIR
ncbi:MAG: hypothetical protein JW785_09105 [Acidimicrobiia bacterium]|nr:hypothetical protein [Acidimicrobiia bacterium]